ncbi:hypothetical protein Sste5346_006605 [Sporothrix stenoceras]|uniref:Pyridoxamine 5'-phosphate oxidase Alr4036 family FMN-binding domain-containing protein n=1 Tax=Sporothrix stenoceras TaxID=5173 RepID=A0ABR3YZM7_9PEZI
MLIRTPQPAASPTALAAPATAAAAPWRALFVQHLGQMPMPLCAVSTLHKNEGGKVTPRVRNCVCRGLWASLPVNAKNPAPRNPTVYESDLPVFTTDARMAKAGEIGLNGGAVEAVWWATDAQTQWRVRGTAWLLGPDVETPTGAVARAAIQKHMRRTEGAAGAGGAPSATSTAVSRTAAIAATTSVASHWSWSREITAHFGNMSPGMRGSFRNPPPGQLRPPRGETGNTSPGEGLGDPVDNDHLDDPTARANFRVCVIVPEEVDQVDLSKGDDPRRWLYTYVGEDSEVPDEAEVINCWAKQELWP